MVREEAVVVRNAKKHYGKGKLVLDGLDMTVSRGSIYGLLGASGCGKTTLLSCVVGVRYLDSGEVWVLGGTPGSKGSGIPGPRVGYMPQDISLIGEFSRTGALYYFGRINGLDDEEIDTRQRFLSELLQLPPEDQLVRNMSGGQQRRVSFAAALIHKPELLILDEPTVGLDPILRENIWTYLIKITQEEDTTVLITTHYIEETKDASKIGLMRNGKLLAESAPLKLLERFQCSFLEEAFLKLCDAQNNAIVLNDAEESKVEDTNSDVLNQDQDKRGRRKENWKYKAVSKHQVSRSKRFKALMIKNGIQFIRHYSGLFFAVMFPIIQSSVFLFAIGNDPKGLKIGVVNDEAGNCNYSSNLGNIWNDEVTCHFDNLSCKFLQNFDDSIAIQKYYDTILEATHHVQNGELTGVLYFNQNFSEALEKRLENGFSTKDSDLITSEIQTFLDMSDRQIAFFLQHNILKRFIKIYEDILKECKYSSKLATPPIRFEDFIYGTSDLTYADYMIPPFLLSLIFFLAVTVSTYVLITERLEGVWDRSLVQGVRTEEIVLSHVILQSIIIVIHTIILTVIFFIIWGTDCKGSIFVAISLVFLNGLVGLMYGFILSALCQNHTMAHFSSAGSFFPLILLNGCLWPLEGMPNLLRWISYILPTTLPSLSLRGILYKGLSISDSEVYIGFLVSLAWIAFYLIVTILSVRSKSS